MCCPSHGAPSECVVLHMALPLNVLSFNGAPSECVVLHMAPPLIAVAICVVVSVAEKRRSAAVRHPEPGGGVPALPHTHCPQCGGAPHLPEDCRI